MTRLGYLGPEGTFSHIAAKLYLSRCGLDATLVPLGTFTELLAEYSTSNIDLVILPLENSIEGEVTQVLDTVTQLENGSIIDEVVVPIHHALMGKPGTVLADIHHVGSHPQPLAQCQNTIRDLCGTVVLRPYSSTAAAAKKLVAFIKSGDIYTDGDLAVIGHPNLAEIYGLTILADHVEDNSTNKTRFGVIGSVEPAPTGNDKTSLAFTAMDEPGALSTILTIVAESGVNLSKINSRPLKSELGDYLFYIDLEGHSQDDSLGPVLEAIKSKSLFFKRLGSYPKDHP
ncbi:prephenate dehydratase [bacterium]|jgi:prephenate dehydratase|nr:prephenate dehydratase [bacterium]